MAVNSTRAYPRFAIDAGIAVTIAGTRHLGRTTNISRGGLCVELADALAPGAAIEVAITLVFDDEGHSEPLVLPASVMWSTAIDERFQVGCRFGALRPRDAAFLEMFLRYLDGGRQDDAGADPPEDPFT